MIKKKILSCKGVHNMISAYIDGALLDREKQLLEQHCATCTDCKRTLEQMKTLVALVSGLPKYTAPADFLVRVNERLDAALEKQQSWWTRVSRAWVTLSYLAAVASLFVVLGYVMHSSDTRIYKGASSLPMMNTVTSGVSSLTNSLFRLPLSRNREIIRSLQEPLRTTLTLLNAIVVSVENDAITFVIPREQYAVAVEHLKAVGYTDVTIVEKDADVIQLKIKNALKMKGN